jgi:hypothetical protein
MVINEKDMIDSLNKLWEPVEKRQKESKERMERLFDKCQNSKGKGDTITFRKYGDNNDA